MKKVQFLTKFPKRKLKPFEVEYSKEEQDMFTLLQEYSKMRIDSSRSHERIASEFVLKLLKNKRVEELHGRVKTEDREKIKAAFQAHPEHSKIRVLVATDAATTWGVQFKPIIKKNIVLF